MRSPSDPEISGVCPVLVTPFFSDGSIDLSSLQHQIEYNLECNVDAIVCFGLASESYKLTDNERKSILAGVMNTVAQRVPVVVGVDHSGFDGAAERARLAATAGAAAIMAYPPTFARPDAPGVVDFYANIAHASGLPVIVQDAPQWTGVSMPTDLLADLRRIAPNVRYVKVETQPSATKITALTHLGFNTIGGYGALHLAEEVSAGIVGTMPGPAMPALYKDLWRLSRQDDETTFWNLYMRALPLLAFQMNSLDLFVNVQKVLLVRSGVLASPHVRLPATPVTPQQVSWLDEIIARTGVSAYVGVHPERELAVNPGDRPDWPVR